MASGKGYDAKHRKEKAVKPVRSGTGTNPEKGKVVKSKLGYSITGRSNKINGVGADIYYTGDTDIDRNSNEDPNRTGHRQR